MKFDVNALIEPDETQFRVNVGERDDGSPVGFVILGANSPAYLKADRAIQLINIKDGAARNGAAIDMSTDAGAEFVVLGSERRREIMLAECVVDWYGFTIGESEPAEFNKDTFVRMMRAKPAWARKLQEEIENEANFTKG